MPWDFAVILLLLGTVVPWRSAVRVRQLLRQPHLPSQVRLAVYASTIVFQWLAVGVVLWRCAVHQWSLERLGLAISHADRTVFAAAVLSSLLIANQLSSLRRLARLPADRQGLQGEMARKLMPQNIVETLAFVALVMTVALCEELLYRGFVFAVVQNAAAGSLVLAAVASTLLFALAHLYQGRHGLVATFVVGLVFASARIWTGNLLSSITGHLFADLCVGLAAPRLLRISLPLAGGEASPPALRGDPPGANN